ncbi:MAG: AAA family ATPase [Gammaproteobacteria bacterium]|nr:AAA family ATPase [Gammaproteobacteria bacterium]
MLIVLGGLPGTGKSTLAVRLAEALGALHLRIDTIEQAMRDAGQNVEGPEGYLVARALAGENLRLGMRVIIDAVNPIAYTRDLWRGLAAETSTRLVEIELVCNDVEEHRRRVEARVVDIDGLRLPTWQEVLDREYEPWRTAEVVDTAGATIEDTFVKLLEHCDSSKGD